MYLYVVMANKWHTSKGNNEFVVFFFKITRLWSRSTMNDFICKFLLLNRKLWPFCFYLVGLFIHSPIFFVNRLIVYSNKIIHSLGHKELRMAVLVLNCKWNLQCADQGVWHWNQPPPPLKNSRLHVTNQIY